MSNIVTRMASTADTDSLARLAKQTFLDAFEKFNEPQNIRAYVKSAFSPSQIAVELLDEDSVFFVAERDSMLVGYAKIRQGEVPACVAAASPAELHRIYVEQSVLGTGIGQMLLDAAIETSRAQQHDVLWLGVWEHNLDAVAFYERFGFERVGEHPFMMGAEQQTDFIMQLTL
ncbi:MAG: GNAT family N-acetyltransferase [Pseudomonadota bacterium]